MPTLVIDASTTPNAIGSYSMTLRGWEGGTLSGLLDIIERHRLAPHGGAVTIGRRVAKIAEGGEVDRSGLTKDQLDAAISIRDITSNARGYTVFYTTEEV